ncbi:class I SAM-dependent methyltransferase [Saccharopolyspora cebuensis]|uniref:Class I SAM-dependent methyltransferase n=1 Tax=Saccharopolyspora cebuensis TaxID=418759 RepID=A0ABV4CH82_9PSEU
MPDTLERFDVAAKSAARYLDQAANGSGAEKADFVGRALRRLPTAAAHVVEVGPGGGAAVDYLAAELARDTRERSVELTLIEAPGVFSESLDRAMGRFRAAGGTCTLRHGFAQDLAGLLPAPVDVIAASALLHEVYSYGGGYPGLHAMIRTLPLVLREGGFFAYRDVYAVAGGDLHERVTQCYSARPWLQFLRLFLPEYLGGGTHPYHHAADELVVRQDSRIVPVRDLDPTRSAIITAPVGLCREIQRHYITARDHLWRTGVLGFRPELEGVLSDDWIDARAGHKRVHYRLTSGRMTEAQCAMLTALSEPYADHLVCDGDVFDEITDVAVRQFFDDVESGDPARGEVWAAWCVREAHETYAYLPLGELLTTCIVNSVAAGAGTVLVPVRADDVAVAERSYYQRYVTRKLANPLRDGKQRVLFANVPLSDSETVRQAWGTIEHWCSKADLARVYAAINGGG